MVAADSEGYRVPDDPLLAEVALALNEAGHWAEILDPEWRVVFVTDPFRVAQGFLIETAPSVAGQFRFGTEYIDAMMGLPTGESTLEIEQRFLARLGGWVIEDLGREALSAQVDPRLADVVDDVSAVDTASMFSFEVEGHGVAGSRPKIVVTAERVRTPDGDIAGTVVLAKPAHDMTLLASLAAMGDRAHFERMQTVARAGHRSGAILFADLEGSTPLAKRLPTASYFALGRRLTRAADRCVVDAGGITGRHSGDGVVAFFLVENLGSELAAASACVHAARSLSAAMTDVASRSGLDTDTVKIRFGLHWGATLYVGLISTVGRTETTALGDDVNDAARIEACATGGRLLASKQLIERLDPDAANELGLDIDGITYVQLGELTTATDKARRDAPSLAVCEL